MKKKAKKTTKKKAGKGTKGKTKPKRTRESRTSGRRLLAKQRQADAVGLKISGLNYREIGEKIGVTRQAAHKQVSNALRDLNVEISEEAGDLRELTNRRLEAAIASIWSRATGTHPQSWAVQRLIELLKSLRSLWGLDAPKKVEVDAKVKTHEEWLRELK